MPIAPDRVKNKIASAAFMRMRMPSEGEMMASETRKNLTERNSYEPEEDGDDSGKLAMMAMWTALQAQDFESAFEAFQAAMRCCP